MRHFDSALPIDDVLDGLRDHLRDGRNAVLVAPPGAGKTTRVPLALLDENWVAGRRLILLEPRRIAARSAAQRMAGSLRETVGETVGLRVRLGSKIGPRTRIEVVTEGVFNRMILDDPMLEGIAAILFDEFHERSLDADLGLALARDAQSGLREDLRLLVMSATLEGARVAALLGDAPIVESRGRTFPVETRHVARDPLIRIEEQIAALILSALQRDEGSILVFLPGQSEIRRVEERLNERLAGTSTLVCPLYGTMDANAQDRAIAAAAPGQRKIVLATAVAETSLTIEGVRIVIDSGLARVPLYEADLGMTRLETVKVSRAAADQRRGRAGRTAPGICYRLWLEAATGAMAPFSTPEILSADLTSLVIDCAAWGVRDPASLPFLDPPPQAALRQARALLTDIGATTAEGELTGEGRALRRLPLPTRLARMVISAAMSGAQKRAADLAALLVERGLGGNDIDLEARLDIFHRERGERAENMRRLAREWARLAQGKPSQEGSIGEEEVGTGYLLGLAFPERIAKSRGAGTGRFQLANGRGASVDPASALAKARYITVGEMTGTATNARIVSAAALGEADLQRLIRDEVSETTETIFDPAAKALRTRGSQRYRALLLGERPLPTPATQESAGILAAGIAAAGLDALPWSAAQQQLRARVAFLRSTGAQNWPDLSDAALTETIDDWLLPFLIGKTAIGDIGADTLGDALATRIPFALKRRIDEEAPSHFVAPTGSRCQIQYDQEGGPRVTIRIQEVFGLTVHPMLGDGQVPLTFELLSPGHRPIQVTRDLPGLWRGSWSAIKAEMKGRYPRHPWPDDPAHAAPTTRAKPRGT